MAGNEKQTAILPSVWDRLGDPDSRGTLARPWYDAATMIDRIRRDLNDLLNTRRTDQGLCPALPRAGESLLAYGFPELGSLELTSHERIDEIGRAIEASVARFEPRMHQVRATPLPSPEGAVHAVRFRIEGTLKLDAAPDVAFETTLELTTGRQTIGPAKA